MLTEIPGIPEIPEPLQLAAIEGRLIPFIGAGASRLAKGPGWDEFADGLLRQLVSHKALNFSQFEQIMSQRLPPRIKLSLARTLAQKKGIALNYEEVIQRDRGMTDPDGVRLYSALHNLAKVFVTTNYDFWLDSTIAPPSLVSAATSTAGASTPATSIPTNVIYQVADISIERLLVPNTVIHLHGSLRDPTSMIVTTRNYLNHYRNDGHGMPENKILTFLRHLFAEKVVLFIGYGMDELEILEYVTLKSGKPRPGTPKTLKHHILLPFFSHELEIANHLGSYFAEECDIAVLPYSRDNNDFQQLIEVLENFARKIPANAPLNIERRAAMEAMLDE